MKKILVPLADGAEEMEAVIIIDTMRRAQWEVTVAGLKEGPVIASRGVKILPDVIWDDINTNDFDIIVLPGGMGGTDNLRKDKRILGTIRDFHPGRIVGAICAGPLVLQEAGILKGKKITCHPSVGDRITEGERLDETVVVDGNIITSQGPGTTFDFALAIIAMAEGKEKADEIARGMIAERKKAFVVE